MRQWLFKWLDRHDNVVADLDGVTDFSVDIEALSLLGQKGKLSMRDTGQAIDFMRDRVQILFDTGTEIFPIATMLMRVSRKQYDAYGAVYDVELTSKLAVLEEATIDIGYTVPAGANIVETITGLIESTGETQLSVTDSATVMPNALTYLENKSILSVVNELSGIANYWAPWVDGSGLIRVEPYRDPADRALTYTFQEGETAIHKPEWVRDQDLASVPNVVRVTMMGDDETAGIQGVAVNSDPASPFSTVSRGQEVTKTYEQDVADLQTANALAQRYLLANMSPVASLEVSHQIMRLEQNQRVRFISQGHDVDATIRNMGYRYSDIGDMTAKWIEAS